MLGFASGLPNVLVNDTLSAWLSDLGFKPADIGLLALITLPYGLKLLWAPLLDRFAAPGFAWLGLRRSWIALLCALLALAFAALAAVGPSAGDSPVVPVAIAGLAIAFLAATLDAAVDAHRTDSASGGEEGPANERTVDVQINRLRRKIERDPADPLLLQTVRSVGYRLVIDRA